MTPLRFISGNDRYECVGSTCIITDARGYQPIRFLSSPHRLTPIIPARPRQDARSTMEMGTAKRGESNHG